MNFLQIIYQLVMKNFSLRNFDKMDGVISFVIND